MARIGTYEQELIGASPAPAVGCGAEDRPHGDHAHPAVDAEDRAAAVSGQIALKEQQLEAICGLAERSALDVEARSTEPRAETASVSTPTTIIAYGTRDSSASGK